jgi:hypothetical protein
MGNLLEGEKVVEVWLIVIKTNILGQTPAKDVEFCFS